MVIQRLKREAAAVRRAARPKTVKQLAREAAKKRGAERRANAAVKREKRLGACLTRCDVIRAGGKKRYMRQIGG